MLKNQIALTANATALNKKIDQLFTHNQITLTDLEGLDNQEREHLAATATKMLDKLTGTDRDNFLTKIDLIMPASTKKCIWEHNQQAITVAVTTLMRQHGIMPSKSAIADQTGLSRQTVAKHFKDYKTHPEHLAEMEQFKFMAPRVLSNVFKYAVNGDMRAARLYFEAMGTINKPQTNKVVNEQNNYLQINNTILSQENLKHLTAEQLNQIESIVRKEEMVRLEG